MLSAAHKIEGAYSPSAPCPLQFTDSDRQDEARWTGLRIPGVTEDHYTTGIQALSRCGLVLPSFAVKRRVDVVKATTLCYSRVRTRAVTPIR